MKTICLAGIALALAAAPAFSQSNPPAAKSGDTPAIATPGEQNPAAPVQGENSFTEDQAKNRMADAGYSDITDLKLDDTGVWRAKAKKDGKAVVVSLDYQGNIVIN